jgi:hypothetical protein
MALSCRMYLAAACIHVFMHVFMCPCMYSCMQEWMNPADYTTPEMDAEMEAAEAAGVRDAAAGLGGGGDCVWRRTACDIQHKTLACANFEPAHSLRCLRVVRGAAAGRATA